MALVAFLPFEIIKIRAQNNQKDFIHYSKEIRTILKEEGIRGLYKGFMINAMRDIPSFAVYFGTYEYYKYFFKQNLNSDSIGIKALCGGLAGMSSWVVIYPLDIIKTRI